MDQNVAFFYYFFLALLWRNGLIFSTFLKCSEVILPVGFYKCFHLEPELELFEVDDIGDGGDDDL